MVNAIGSIDWLVVSLSGGQGAGPIADLDLGMLRRAFDAKFWGYITIQVAMPHLAATGPIRWARSALERACPAPPPGIHGLTRVGFRRPGRVGSSAGSGWG